MNREQLIKTLNSAKWYDLTQALSIFTPPYPGEMSLQVHFFKRLTLLPETPAEVRETLTGGADHAMER